MGGWLDAAPMLRKLLLGVLVAMTLVEFYANAYVAITGYLWLDIPMWYVHILTLIVWLSWFLYRRKRRASTNAARE
jgi:hypothetical protein